MKNCTIDHVLLFLVFMLAYQCASAQSDYLVTTRGDTVRGEFKLMFYAPDKKVQVKNGKDKTTYSILETKSFSFENEIYKPVKGPDGYAFMKVIKGGYLSLMAFQMKNATSYDGRYLLKIDGQGMEVPNLGFKKNMVKFLDDCEAVSTKIDQDTYNKKNLEDIVDEYNICITNKTNVMETAIAQRKETGSSQNSWDELIEKINQHEDFPDKATAVEMATDIKKRISRGEKAPNFVVDGLKNILANQNDLKEILDNALAEMGQ
jgi:hypothetical protein